MKQIPLFDRLKWARHEILKEALTNAQRATYHAGRMYDEAERLHSDANMLVQGGAWLEGGKATRVPSDDAKYRLSPQSERDYLGAVKAAEGVDPKLRDTTVAEVWGQREVSSRAIAEVEALDALRRVARIGKLVASLSRIVGVSAKVMGLMAEVRKTMIEAGRTVELTRRWYRSSGSERVYEKTVYPEDRPKTRVTVHEMLRRQLPRSKKLILRGGKHRNPAPQLRFGPWSRQHAARLLAEALAAFKQQKYQEAYYTAREADKIATQFGYDSVRNASQKLWLSAYGKAFPELQESEKLLRQAVSYLNAHSGGISIEEFAEVAGMLEGAVSLASIAGQESRARKAAEKVYELAQRNVFLHARTSRPGGLSEAAKEELRERMAAEVTAGRLAEGKEGEFKMPEFRSVEEMGRAAAPKGRPSMFDPYWQQFKQR